MSDGLNVYQITNELEKRGLKTNKEEVLKILESFAKEGVGDLCRKDSYVCGLCGIEFEGTPPFVFIHNEPCDGKTCEKEYYYCHACEIKHFRET